MSKTILVNILILFFIILIGYQIILANRIVEGLENNANATNANATNANTYTPYDTNNPDNALILSQKNAGNIDYLKQRIDNVQDIFQEVQDLSANVSALQEQVNGIISAHQDTIIEVHMKIKNISRGREPVRIVILSELHRAI